MFLTQHRVALMQVCANSVVAHDGEKSDPRSVRPNTHDTLFQDHTNYALAEDVVGRAQILENGDARSDDDNEGCPKVLE